MNARTRILSAVAAAATAGSVFAAVTAPSAFADGKSTMGCSPSYTLGSFNQIEILSASIIGPGLPFPTLADEVALLTSLDHNGDGYLCFKLPPGWDGPPATNGAQRAGFLNLVDDFKVLPG